MKRLKKHRSPWVSVKEHWEATKEYRCNSNQLQQDSYDTIFEQNWPIFMSKIGPELVSFYYTSDNSYFNFFNY